MLRSEVIFPILNKSHIFQLEEIFYTVLIDRDFSHVGLSKKIEKISSFLQQHFEVLGFVELSIQSKRLEVKNANENRVFKFDSLELLQNDFQQFVNKQTYEQKTKYITGLNNKLVESNKKVTQLIEDKNYLINFLAHEVRNPLNALMNYSKLLAESPELLEGIDLGEVLMELTGDMKQIVDDVLDFSKLEASKLTVSRTKVDVVKFARLFSSQMSQLVKNQGLEFKFVCDLPEDTLIMADKNRLKQVLNNFLSNALKFTQKGYILLEVSKTQNNEISFSIHDTGAGISKEFQQQIFQEFSQEKHVASSGKGTGLGMNICWKLSELMGARLDCISERGVGSTFSIIFPEIVSQDSVLKNEIQLSKENLSHIEDTMH
ncbi:MAG: hypothetical protein CME62_06860 [Halobacteriovoraceae bacterium]|nr:hypothetical protein [Halobacteriovoraceae bacterium]|tara:strand:+ start:5988 stop:7112 length:1125 start_codon:yes stop_codon:yes gene_type:complete